MPPAPLNEHHLRIYMAASSNKVIYGAIIANVVIAMLFEGAALRVALREFNKGRNIRQFFSLDIREQGIFGRVAGHQNQKGLFIFRTLQYPV
jgi:hypothetical protein